ncbi:hypothetical protein CcCBS67573_g08271 [Chytriomyces confervae]|uniref:Long-chain-alcohol oxidase n=1 Tax=Chytriomyces confervae TaxID=246404 RepID=A0A507ENX1_9FUNG|nr:hypothetical protein HDU80_002440 [Chytriomyces hyalinus]TPX64950.1 hypothetical protein CcCBS67573_g08271 [Chytriomyces confervae]
MSLKHLPSLDEAIAATGLNDTHVNVLRAMLDALLPPADDTRALAAAANSTAPVHALESFATTTPSQMDAVNVMLPVLAVTKPAQVHSQLRTMLWLLSTGPGTFLLTGYTKPFPDLSPPEKETAMLMLANSRIADLRTVFHSLKVTVALSCLGRSLKLDPVQGSIAFQGTNPFWEAMNYPGMPTEKPLPENYDHVWSPTFLDINTLANGAKTFTIETDAVVIGSGCGGGVVAAELAKAGHRVLVLEKGKHRKWSDFTSNEMESMFSLFEQGGSVQSDDGAITVLAGSTFGGGSYVNWSCSLRPPHKVREEWATKHNLPHFTSKAFSDSIDAICARNGVTDQGIEHNVPNQILLEGAKRLGYPSGVLPQNIGTNDHKCGFCHMGCPYAEKQGTHVTWLQDAAEHGAQFIQECKVNRITHKNGIATGVRATLTALGIELIVKAKTVVSSCGSLNTPLLLTRSGLKNANIGRNLRLHPVVPVQAYFPDREIKPYFGPIMTAISNVLEDRTGSGYGARLEIPIMHPAFFGAFSKYRSSSEWRRMLLQFNHRAMMIVLTRDEDSVSRVYEDTDNLMHLDFSLGSKDATVLTEGVVASTKVFLAAGAAEVDPGMHGLEALVLDEQDLATGDAVNCAKAVEYYKKIRETGIVATKTHIGCAHQMGSCRMGASPAAGAVDPEGQSWEVKGLYVADASLFPTASGVNPMITTLSVAHSVAQFIKKNLSAGQSKL